MRNLKALGLALSAALAIGVLASSAAQAAEVLLTAEEYPAIITGTKITNSEHPKHIFTYGSFGVVDCDKTSFAGTLKEAGQKSVTVTPTYSECKAFGLPATVTMNSCDYVFHNETVDIACSGKEEAPKHIIVDVYASAVKHAENQKLCELTIGVRSNLEKNIYSNTAATPNDVDLTNSLTEIVGKRFGGSALLCGPSEAKMTYKGLATLEAFKDLNGGNTEGAQIGLTYSENK